MNFASRRESSDGPSGSTRTDLATRPRSGVRSVRASPGITYGSSGASSGSGATVVVVISEVTARVRVWWGTVITSPDG